MDYLTDNWDIVVSALSGILLFAVVLALIFNRGFRKDLAAARGKAKILGLLSVEGVVVVVLCCIFFIGLIYPVYRRDGNAPVLPPISHANAAQDPNEDDLPRQITALSPEDPISAEIRAIADSGKGPWSPYSASKEIRISVPGKLPPGKVLACPEWQDKTLELISNHRERGKILRGESSISVKVNGLIFAATNCRDIAGYDIKLNCEDANKLFSADVLECDSKDNPRWKAGGDHLLPAYAAVIINHGS